MKQPAQLPPPTRYFSRVAAAQYVCENYGFSCSPKWLAKLACVGGGPAFHKAGRYTVYAAEDLDRWATARIGPRQTCTNDTASSPDDPLTSDERGRRHER
ncbi:hypothetical protein [Acuticoccus kandeliae]|uniref:hypothetical protein n=1 Tax=Acuticoccus kandeliae TaxID=2073160 RepID=UPI00196AA5AA|nr:hypothetical protein [Acuticoccus kandeliae]